ncbi:MAG: hypothetical protein ACTSUO_05430 [Candidatus Thorarchaeota archaeon]
MAWTVLSTVEELKRDVPALLDTDVSDTTLESIIDDAKKVIYDDLSKYVDWDEVEALDDVPRFLSRLSRYQSAMLTIERHWYSDSTMLGSGVEGEEGGNTLYRIFEKRYKELISQIQSGEIMLLDSDNEELESDVARSPGLGRII